MSDPIALIAKARAARDPACQSRNGAMYQNAAYAQWIDMVDSFRDASGVVPEEMRDDLETLRPPRFI